MQLSTNQIHTKVVKLALAQLKKGDRCLDIGSGTGALIEMLKKSLPELETHSCDYTDSLMQAPGQKVDIVNLDEESLPYKAESFDLVTCTEVIEHLENYRDLLREIYRVTKPGGTAIFTTPNVLNLNSRLRFFLFGFWNLFGPLPVNRSERYSTRGHITPVFYFYLAHALAECGFEISKLEIDKIQRSSLLKSVIFWPFIALFGMLIRQKERRKYKTIDSSNESMVATINSAKILLGRTIIVVAQKPVN